MSAMDVEPKALIAAQQARPFSTTFNRQIVAARSLYGSRLKIPQLTREEICRELDPLLPFYPERDRGIITDRVCRTIRIRQKEMMK